MRPFVSSFCILVLSTVGCGTVSQPPDPLAVPLQNAPSFLKIPTYDGSGQVTEPNVISFDSPWHGFRYWMAFSPYTNGDESKENPSIAGSNDGVTWEVPSGLTNPLELPSKGYFADASLFYDSPSDQLWVYYIHVSGARDYLEVSRFISPDGVHWRNQGVLLRLPTYEALSPTVAKVDSTLYMWAVNAGAAGCSTATSTVEYRTSSDGVKWSNSYSTNMVLPGYVIWHLNVAYVAAKQEYWAAVTAYRDGSDCSDTALFFAASRDGINWNTYAKRVLAPSGTWDSEGIYRSTMLFDRSTNHILVWYSAVSQSGVWHVGLAQGDFDSLLEWLQP